ncbi:hypothetical protein MKX08_008064 [Trichoderma sp. CBMAI-0020]|nr:hypothetical protein MKX08_008064 [Trichoderma sp. CBMAI-0020]WOD46704.1 hypothetical protein [Trichoderma atroviride]
MSEGLAPRLCPARQRSASAAFVMEDPAWCDYQTRLGAHWGLLNLQRNPADVTGLCCAERLSNYPNLMAAKQRALTPPRISTSEVDLGSKADEG